MQNDNHNTRSRRVIRSTNLLNNVVCIAKQIISLLTKANVSQHKLLVCNILFSRDGDGMTPCALHLIGSPCHCSPNPYQSSTKDFTHVGNFLLWRRLHSNLRRKCRKLHPHNPDDSADTGLWLDHSCQVWLGPGCHGSHRAGSNSPARWAGRSTHWNI